jgi:hypothetical protein
MKEPNIEGWYAERKARDAAFEEQNEALLGRERQVFLGAISACRGALDAAFVDGPMNDLDAKAKIVVAELAYEMLWSAWREMLAGRYGSSISHWRSISEAPEILRALTVRPDLAQVWFKNQLKIEKARRAVRDALKDQGHAA